MKPSGGLKLHKMETGYKYNTCVNVLLNVDYTRFILLTNKRQMLTEQMAHLSVS